MVDGAAGASQPLPADLRRGAEALSGLGLGGVKVHHNSPAPAAIGAAAFAQGRDIHLGPGQAHHLPHETWHVVQQAQGRVQPTKHLGQLPVNDSPALEAEATKMGERAQQQSGDSGTRTVQAQAATAGVVQGYFTGSLDGEKPVPKKRLEPVKAYLAAFYPSLLASYDSLLASDEPTSLPDWLESHGIDEDSDVADWVHEGRKVPSTSSAAVPKSHAPYKPEPYRFATKGGFHLQRAGSFTGDDSEGDEFHMSHRKQAADLRKTAIKAQAKVAKKRGRGTPNVIAAGITIVYRHDGKNHEWRSQIPDGWNSGLTQYLGHDHDEEDIADDLSDWLWDIDKDEAPEGLNLNVKFKGGKGAFAVKANTAANAAPFGHSETAMAAARNLRALLATQVRTFLNGLGKIKKEVVILATSLDADSYPNTVCMGACRLAIDEVRLHLHEVVEEEIDALGDTRVRLSGNNQTHSRVTAARPFQPNQNPQHRDMHKGKTPIPYAKAATETDHGINMEILAGGEGKLAKRPKKRKSSSGAKGGSAKKTPQFVLPTFFLPDWKGGQHPLPDEVLFAGVVPGQVIVINYAEYIVCVREVDVSKDYPFGRLYFAVPHLRVDE